MQRKKATGYAQKQYEWLWHLQSMILSGQLTAWKDYVSHMDLWELEELISPFEGFGEIIEEMDPAWGY